MYGMGNGTRGYGYGFEHGSRVPSSGSASGGSTALYHHHGTRYGLSGGLGGRVVGPESKMNGLHGPKHKRGDVDRECAVHDANTYADADVAEQSIVSRAFASKIWQASSQSCARTSTGAATCRKNSRK